MPTALERGLDPCPSCWLQGELAGGVLFPGIFDAGVDPDRGHVVVAGSGGGPGPTDAIHLKAMLRRQNDIR